MSKTPYFRLLLRFCGIGLLLFAGLQFARPELRNPPVAAEIQAPAEVKAIFKHSCYNCHSNETELAWFDRIVPAYWIIPSTRLGNRSAARSESKTTPYALFSVMISR
jgi:mono/diheme cytochrome c family protein